MDIPTREVARDKTREASKKLYEDRLKAISYKIKWNCGKGLYHLDEDFLFRDDKYIFKDVLNYLWDKGYSLYLNENDMYITIMKSDNLVTLDKNMVIRIMWD